MDLRKLRLPVALALICIASFVTFLQVKANEETDDPVGPSAVWEPDSDDFSEIAQACNTVPDYGQCFVGEMENLASSEAVDFSRSLLELSPSRPGYLKELREAGPVDLGLVVHSQAGKLSQGWVLLNGMPAIVDVEDTKLLPQSAMEKNPQFSALRKSHPKIQLAADMDQSASPEMQRLSNGGQRFILSYVLQEPCSSCQPMAHARFGFDFDAAGKFLGAKFIQVAP